MKHPHSFAWTNERRIEASADGPMQNVVRAGHAKPKAEAKIYFTLPQVVRKPTKKFPNLCPVAFAHLAQHGGGIPKSILGLPTGKLGA